MWQKRKASNSTKQHSFIIYSESPFFPRKKANLFLTRGSTGPLLGGLPQFWYRVFFHLKERLLDFLTDYVLISFAYGKMKDEMSCTLIKLVVIHQIAEQLFLFCPIRYIYSMTRTSGSWRSCCPWKLSLFIFLPMSTWYGKETLDKRWGWFEIL